MATLTGEQQSELSRLNDRMVSTLNDMHNEINDNEDSSTIMNTVDELEAQFNTLKQILEDINDG